MKMIVMRRKIMIVMITMVIIMIMITTKKYKEEELEDEEEEEEGGGGRGDEEEGGGRVDVEDLRFTISSLYCGLSPTRKTWHLHSRVQIIRNTSGDNHMQHVLRHVL